MEMVGLLLIMFNDAVFMLLLFAASIWKLLSLTQGMVKLFSKVTISLGNNNIEKEWGGKYETDMVGLLLILFDDSVFLPLLFADAFQKFVLKLYSSLYCKLCQENKYHSIHT